MAKLKKQEMSDKINCIMGLEGKDCIDWTRLSMDDITVFYVMLGNPDSLSKIAKNVMASIVPEFAKDFAGKDVAGVMSDLVGAVAEEGVEKAMGNPDIRKLAKARAKDMMDKSDLLKNRPVARRILEQVMKRAAEEDKRDK